MKKLFFSLAWLWLSVGVIFTSIAGYAFYRDNIIDSLQNSVEKNNVMIASSESAENSQEFLNATTIVESDDARALIVANFLKRYNTPKPEGVRNLNHPLVPEKYFGQFFVELADEYNIDFRLLPAIAMQESNLCISIPDESYNCLGFGVYGNKVTKFPSFEANFEQAAKTLKKYYIDIGLDTPYKIMKKYTPPSDGSWAESVNQWMSEMRYDDRTSGIKLKEDADLYEFVNTEENAEASQSTQ